MDEIKNSDILCLKVAILTTVEEAIENNDEDKLLTVGYLIAECVQKMQKYKEKTSN